MGANDEAQVKIASRIDIDISLAKRSLAELSAEMRRANENLRQMNKPQLLDQFGKPMQTMAEAAQRASGHIHGMKLSAEQLQQRYRAMLPTMEAQVAAVQQRLRAEKLSNSEIGRQASLMRSSVKELMEQQAVAGKLGKAEQLRTKELAEQVQLLKAAAKTQLADTKRPMSFADQVTSQFDRRLSWFASGALIVGGTNQLRQGLELVGDMETRMVSINRVMNDTAYQSGAMRKELSELGKEYGFQFATVSDIAQKWAQAGYSAQQSLEAVKSTLLGLNTAELDAESGTTSLIAIMKQWDMQTSEMTGLIDQLNLSADRFPVTTQALVDALMRSGSAARTAGIDIQNLIGLIVSMQEATGRSGANVGTALNSILSFATRKESLETFQASGVAVFADVATGKLRPLIDILNDVAANWTTLSDQAKDAMAAQAEAAGIFGEEMADALGKQAEWNDLQKRDISAAAASTYRRNYLLSLLSNFARVQDTVNTLQQAEGYSLKENAKAMESYQKKAAQLKATFEDVLYQIAGETGILSGLKGMVDGLAAGADWWSKLDVSTRQALLAMTAISGVMIAVNAAMTRMAGVSIAQAIAQLVTFKGVVGAATAASAALNTVLGAVFSPTGLIIMGVAALGGLWAYNAAQAKKTEEAVRNAAAQADELEKLRTRYASLAENTKRTSTEETELADVSKRLLEIMPSLASGFDSFGKAMLNTHEVADKTKAKIKELREETHALLEEEAKVGSTRLPDLQSKLAAYEERFGRIRAAVMQGPDALGMDLYIGVQPWDSASTKMAKAEKSLSDLRDRMAETTQQINIYRSAIAAVSTPIDTGYDDIIREKEARRKGTGTTVTSPGQFAPPGGDVIAQGVRAVTDAILDQVDAAKALGEQTDSLISVVKSRLDYESREGATAEELAQADLDRAKAIDLLKQRQTELHDTAVAARGAIDSLRAAQAGLDTSTEEGASAYSDLEDKINSLIKLAGDGENGLGELSSQWWTLQSELRDLMQQNNAQSTIAIRNLGDLSQKYQDGLITLEQYVNGLARLEKQAGLSADAITQLNSAQAKALKEQFSQTVGDAFTARLEDLDDKIKDVGEQLKRDTDLLETIFDGFEAQEKRASRAGVRTSLANALAAFNGAPRTFAPAASTSISSLANLAMGGPGLHNLNNLGKLSPEEFAKAMNADLTILRGFSTDAKGLLEQVNGYATQRLSEIEDQLTKIDRRLEKRVSALKAELDALDAEAKEDERAKAYEEHNKRVAELQDERTWLTLQNEADMAFKVAAIDAQLATEQESWSEQQTEWDRSDRRDRIQAQITEAERAAEIKRRQLEDERTTIQEQQRLYGDLLSAVVEYVNSEIDARREAVAEFKQGLQDQADTKVQDLENTKTWLEQMRKDMGEGWANILADMAANDPNFLARGQAMVQNIINGINGKKAELQQAVNELNAIMGQYREAQATNAALENAKALAKGGNLDAAAKALSGAYNITQEQAKENLKDLVPKFAASGLVRYRPGGTLIVAGEEADEVVMSRRHAIPLLTDALRGALGNISGGVGFDASAMARAVREGLSNLTLYGEMNVGFPDGTVKKEIIRFFAPLRQAVSGA